MAEPIGIASGLITLIASAFKSTVILHDTVKSYEKHPKHVRELLDELTSLAAVLESLQDSVLSGDASRMSNLDMPLRRCGAACTEFQQELVKRTLRSGNGKSFRDWISLKYMGEDIRGFKDLLSRYKSTITIALNDANLRKTTATFNSIEEQKTLIHTLQEDLESRLAELNKRFDTILGNTVTDSDADAADMQLLKDEQDTTQRCLDICASLLAQINQIRPAPGSDSKSEGMFTDGLQECTEYLDATIEKLENHMRDVIDRMIAKKTTSSEELERLRDDWQSARQCRAVCARADRHLKERVSIIRNDAHGRKTFQLMVSTNDTILHGSNQGRGDITYQVGGHFNEESFQQLSRDMVSLNFQNAQDRSSGEEATAAPQSSAGGAPHNEGFDRRYGRGCTLHETGAAKR